MKIESNSQQETEEIAKNLAKNIKPPFVYCLNGDLGAGKTVFAKGFAKGLGIRDLITSPTFTIVNEYEGDISFYHIDAYRLDGGKNGFEEFEDYLYKGGVCLIEWADIIKSYIPENAVWITIEKNIEISENYRIIKIG